MLSSQQLQSAASFRRDWESNAAHLLRCVSESVDRLYLWLRIWGLTLRSQPLPPPPFFYFIFFLLERHVYVGLYRLRSHFLRR